MLYHLAKPILFAMEPEKAHHFAMKAMTLTAGFPYRTGHGNRPVEFAGLVFPNKIGLAAGFDKNAQYLDVLSRLGFGHIETGTVTPLPQPGNPKPRLFRLLQDEALINRMGFNNQGVDVAVARIEAFKKKNQTIVIGGNIGKNKDTKNEDAVQDYLKCFRKMYHTVDYFTVNVSSPNTPGLKQLQEKESLFTILRSLAIERNDYVAKGLPRRPIMLKIAPDLTWSQVDEVIQVFFDSGIEALIASNTTIDRSGLRTSKNELESIGAGGLSGKPLTKKSTELVAYITEQSDHKIPIIASGGVMSADDAKQKMDAGASLVQIYTGFIYKGPKLVKEAASRI